MVNDRFIELLTKKLSDEISEAERAELDQILADDAECRQQYKFFKNYWTKEEERYSNDEAMFRRIKNRISLNEREQEEQLPTPKLGRRYFFTWMKIAASFVIATTVFGYYLLIGHHSHGKSINSLQVTKTPSRTKSKIYLSDGSIITLNSETVLKYPSSFDGATREVYLDGEAFFDVAKDHAHPFIVHAGKMNVKVLGTAFNIKSYANDKTIETTLLRGAVEVTLADRPADRIILKPNEKLVLNNNNLQKQVMEQNQRAKLIPHNNTVNYSLTGLTRLKASDTTIVETSWVNNQLVFKDESFTDLANQMERWYGVKVKFKNEKAESYHFTGVFVKENVIEALNALKMIEPFDYKYKNETIYIY